MKSSMQATYTPATSALRFAARDFCGNAGTFASRGCGLLADDRSAA